MRKVFTITLILLVFAIRANATPISVTPIYELSTFISDMGTFGHYYSAGDCWWMNDNNVHVTGDGSSTSSSGIAIFDLYTLNAPIQSATLTMQIDYAYVGMGGYNTNIESYPFALYDVNDLSNILPPPEGTELTLDEYMSIAYAARADLTSGNIYGIFDVITNTYNRSVSITLSQEAIEDINNVLLSDSNLFGIGISDLSDVFSGFGGSRFSNIELSVAPVPEPATILLFGIGLAGLAGTARRKLKK